MVVEAENDARQEGVHLDAVHGVAEHVGIELLPALAGAPDVAAHFLDLHLEAQVFPEFLDQLVAEGNALMDDRGVLDGKQDLAALRVAAFAVGAAGQTQLERNPARAWRGRTPP